MFDLCIIASSRAILIICLWKSIVFSLRCSTSTGTFLRYWNHFYCTFIPKTTHFIGHQELVSPMSAIITAELQYQSIDENTRPPTLDWSHYRLILSNRIHNQTGQDLKYKIIPVNIINSSLHFAKNISIRELNSLSQTATALTI